MEKNTTSEMILEKIQKVHFKKRGNWHVNAFYIDLFLEGESATNCRRMGFPFGRNVGVWLAAGDYLDDIADWNYMKDYMVDQQGKDSSYIKQFGLTCIAKGEQVLEKSKAVRAINAKDLSDDELIAHIQNFRQESLDYLPYMMVVHTIDEWLTEKFISLLDTYAKGHNLTNQEKIDYQTFLTYPFRKIFALTEREDLLAIGSRFQKENGDSDNPTQELLGMIKNHAVEYGWMNAYLFESTPLDAAGYIKKLKGVCSADCQAELALIQKQEKEFEQAKVKYMELVGQDSELYMVSDLIQIYGFLRSFRVDVLFKLFADYFGIITEAATRLGLEAIDIRNLTIADIASALTGKLANYTDIVKVRKTGVAAIMADDIIHVYTGEDVTKVAEQFKAPEQDLGSISSVKGMVAYGGSITGPCKVLFALEDMHKIQIGDILVIAMTDPNYLPAMEKAAAFVTDQGGILCHAAIVSREMKKPCVIGTKVATKVFKDGDILTVDADNGTVYKK